LTKNDICPFFDDEKNRCSLYAERMKQLPYGGFGGCLTLNYPKCDAYKRFKWRLRERVAFT